MATSSDLARVARFSRSVVLTEARHTGRPKSHRAPFVAALGPRPSPPLQSRALAAGSSGPARDGLATAGAPSPKRTPCDACLLPSALCPTSVQSDRSSEVAHPLDLLEHVRPRRTSRSRHPSGLRRARACAGDANPTARLLAPPPGVHASTPGGRSVCGPHGGASCCGPRLRARRFACPSRGRQLTEYGIRVNTSTNSGTWVAVFSRSYSSVSVLPSQPWSRAAACGGAWCVAISVAKLRRS